LKIAEKVNSMSEKADKIMDMGILMDPANGLQPSNSGPTPTRTISSPDEAAAFTATAANLKEVIYSLEVPSIPKFIEQRMADQYQETLQKRTRAAWEVLGKLSAIEDTDLRRHITISMFLLYEPFKNHLDSLLLEPKGGDIRKRVRSAVTKTLLRAWGVQFDNNLNESSYFDIGINGLLVAAVTYPKPSYFDRPGLSIDLLESLGAVYKRESPNRFAAFNNLINQWSSKPGLSEYQVRRLNSILQLLGQK
jgi:hypothetical protein